MSYSIEDRLSVIESDGAAMRVQLEKIAAKVGAAPIYVNKTRAAEICGIDAKYLRELVKAGDIPVVDLGGVERIMVESLVEFGRTQINKDEAA